MGWNDTLGEKALSAESAAVWSCRARFASAFDKAEPRFPASTHEGEGVRGQGPGACRSGVRGQGPGASTAPMHDAAALVPLRPAPDSHVLPQGVDRR